MMPAVALRRLPERRQRVLALLALIVMVVLSVVLILGPVVAKHGQYAQDYADARYRLTRTLAALERLPEVRRTVETLRQRVDASDSYLPQGSASVAGARVQQMLNKLAAETGASLDSSTVLEPERDGNLVTIRVRLDAHGEIGELARFMRGIETGQPVLVVDQLVIERDNRRTPSNREPYQPVVLRASMEVHGVLRGTQG